MSLTQLIADGAKLKLNGVFYKTAKQKLSLRRH